MEKNNPNPGDLDVGRMPPSGETPTNNAGSGDPAYREGHPPDVGRMPPSGETPMNNANTKSDANAGPEKNAGSGDPAYREPPPRRLRRLHRVWPDRDGNISYLLTLCVDGRFRALANHETLGRLSAFLLDSPARYDWYPRRFVLMPDHLHLIAHQGREAVRLGQYIKALKAVVGGLERRIAEDVGRVPSPGETPVNNTNTRAGKNAGSGDPAYRVGRFPHVGRMPPSGEMPPPGTVPSSVPHEYTRIKRSWHWQEGFHDHKFRTPESEQRKWEYVCMNPVRYGLVARPEQWPFGGEIFYEDSAGPRLVQGTPPLLDTGMLVAEEAPRYCNGKPPSKGGVEM